MSDDGAVGDCGVALEDVNTDVATAFGLFALSDASIREAADEVDVSRWELEDQIGRAGLAETFGLDDDRDVSATIDDLLDGS